MIRTAGKSGAGRAVVFGLLVCGLSACAGKNAGTPEARGIDPVDNPSGTAQALADEWSTDAAAAAPVSSVAVARSSRMLAEKDSGLGIELVDGQEFNELVLSAARDFRFEVSELPNPRRLVVDLFGVPSKATRSYETADAQYVSRVRVGAHPEKSRVVLDLPANAEIGHVVTPASNTANVTEVRITLAANDADARTAAFFGAEEPAVEFASPTVEREAAPVFADAASAAEFEEQAPPAVAAVAEPAFDGDRTRVVGVSIDKISPSENMVVAQLTSDAPFQFRRSAPSEYVLTIPGAELGENTSASVISPAGAGEIRTVRPVAQGGDVLLRIFTTPQTSLVARSSSGKIVVTASKLGFEDANDMRAQADTSQAAKPAGNAELKVSDAASAGDDLDVGVAALLDEQPKYTGRLISLDLQDTDIDNALRIIAEVSNLNIIASDDVTGKVTLRLIDVPWDQALDVILKTNGLDKVQEGNVVRIAPVEKLRLEREALKQAQQAEEDLEPLSVRYIRVSYAKSADLRPLVESVISERGSVAYDERTNQLIVKDIRNGIRNVVELVSKLDLRTPQILLETQIVEANRSLLRSLGAEFGFNYVASPATGNATGWNFPNAVTTGGTSRFPGASDPELGGSSISFLLESADATRSLNATLTALEDEGRIRVVSRPAVATTNNTPAQIKSIEKIRIKTPSGGLSVATGQGATASGSSATATESVEIGIILDVTPQASPDYFVLLDVKAKSSAFGSQTVDGIPSEIERSATSSVLVSSGQTFAMGGIYRIIDSDSVTGVPFLKDIPVLGSLFRVQRSTNSDEELLFFLTPRIVEGSFDDAAMKVSL